MVRPFNGGIFIAILGVALSALTNHAHASQHCSQPVAQIVSSFGTVQYLPASTQAWQAADLNLSICAEDSIRTGAESRAALVFLDTDTVLRIDQNTQLTVRTPPDERRSLLDLLIGSLHFFSRTPRALEVQTPFVNAGVEGTEFFIRVTDDRASLVVFEGGVRASNDLGEVILADNQAAEVVAGQAPALRVVARPRDAVQWTLFFPPVYTDPVSPALSALLRDTAGLLAAGQVEEASVALEAAPETGDVLALRTIIAVALNEREQAFELGRQAVAKSPNSAAAKIALSYAQQAGFDLEAARDTVREATNQQPDDALAWARLAELWLSLGDLRRALEAAETAAALAPGLSRTNMVLGFVFLAQIRTAQAKEAFEKAIALDSQDPLARLGLGLAKIRDGDLSEGRQDIEIAAALDPNKSLLRSYLGKAFFDEKRAPLDADQFALAKKFDPNDPTPWFYDAIRKQTENRPVEALQDLQKSIELNNNRAVFRSRLLLDEDLAARSAGLGRIYTDLGFGQLALVEGFKSVNADPGNHSAHRFLADTYAALPRHEIARVSELLQSQLRQPINITPVQPQLAESNLFIVEGSGPSGPSFNEFNPLFARDRIALQASGVVGNNSLAGDDLTVAGVEGRYSLSAGQFHIETDGFRENNDLQKDIYNVFGQVRLSHYTSVQAELRTKDFDRGDLQLRFDPDNFSSIFRQEDDIDSLRFGLHYIFSPNSDFIANISFQSGKFKSLFPEISEVTIDDDGFTGEVQHLYETPNIRFITGLGRVAVDRKTTLQVLFFPLPPIVDRPDIRHNNAYLYSHIDFPQDVTLTLGASGDLFEGETVDTDQFNPKFGLIWTPVPATTVRAAAFRTLKRTLLSDQTLEPTQVAGFNQFFDDREGTDAWRYGIAIDQRLSAELFAGGEFSKRDLEVPGLDLLTSDVIRKDFDEYLGRAYLNWTPHPWWALSAEYQYEEFTRDLALLGPEDFTELETHRFALGAGFFHPSGLRANAKATYLDQTGEVGDSFGIGDIVPGDDQSWVVDASLGYRLPKRFGLITLGAKNLFDDKFKFQDTDPGNPSIAPERQIFFNMSLFF